LREQLLLTRVAQLQITEQIRGRAGQGRL